METGWKKDWKKDLLRYLPVVVIGILWIYGFFCLLIGWQFFPMLLNRYSVDYVLDNGAKKGMFVIGEVPYTYHCFAEMTDTRVDKATSYYYAIPTDENFLVLRVPASKKEVMDTLLEETLVFLDTGVPPLSPVYVEGFVEEAPGRVPYLLGEYLKEIGYIQEEIDAMGQPLMLQEESGRFEKVRIYGPLGFVLIMAGIVIFVPCVIFSKRRRE